MKRARRIMVCALAVLLLLGGLGVSAALAAGTEGEAAGPAAAAESGLIVVENREITLVEENVPLAASPEGPCCVLHLLLLSLALLAELFWAWDARQRQQEEFALRAQLTARR